MCVRVCVCVCVCVCMVCRNLQGSVSDSGWDLCVDGPPVIKVVMAVLNQRTARRTEGGRTLGDDFRKSWLRHVMLLAPASPWNSLATG